MTLARLLPPELLAKIFEHASGMGWTRAPIVASHVCSTWRAAARAHPSVWSYITINFDLQDRTGWTKHWLSMARQASLHVTLEYSVYNRAFGRVMALLFERSEQWVSLDLDMPPEETQLVLIACKPHNFTRLRSIHTSLYACSEGLEDTERFTSFADAFQNAPSLTSFSVFGNALPRDLPLGLTSICMEYNDPFGPNVENPHSVLEVLRNLPNLESLTMRLGVLTPTPPAFPGVELPELRTLVYEDLHAGDFQILSYLAAPSLRHLRACVQSGPEVCDVVPTYLIPFLEDSPNVETLELDGIDVWPARWPSILPRLPKLRELYLHDSDIDDKAVEGMFGKNGSCPDLQRIDLRWCQHVRGTTLAQLVESRVNSGGREIDEVATIGCSLVRKQDAMQIARLTTFRVVIGERDEHCRQYFSIAFSACR